MTSPLEALAFAIGIKPALRLSLSREDAVRETARWKARGASVVPGSSPVSDGGRHLLYVARGADRATAARDAEALIVPHGRARTPDAAVRAAHRALGRQLGYPPCCVEAFLARLERGVTQLRDGTRASEGVVAAERAWHASKERLARLNVLLPRRRALVPFDPCSFDCEAARRYATALLGAHRVRSPDDAADLERALLRSVRLGRSGPVDPADGATEVLLELHWDAL